MKPISNYIACTAASGLIVATFGCASGRVDESYYFPGMKDGEVVNYYRVNVTGRIIGERLRYLSGFFDEEALDRYFNTYSQPESGIILSQKTPSNAGSGPMVEVAVGDPDTPCKDDGKAKKEPKPEPKPEPKVQVDPSGKGRKFVMILSQNSEAVANQIGAIAQGEAMASSVGTLIFGDQLREREDARMRAERLSSSVSGLRREIISYVTQAQSGVKPPDKAALDEDQRLEIMNRAAAPLGEGPFANLEEAKNFLDNRRAQIWGGK